MYYILADHIFRTMCSGLHDIEQGTSIKVQVMDQTFKHGLNFQAVQYVSADPLAISNIDPYPHDERWQTIGLLGNITLLIE